MRWLALPLHSLRNHVPPNLWALFGSGVSRRRVGVSMWSDRSLGAVAAATLRRSSTAPSARLASVATPRRRHAMHEVLLVDPDRDVREALSLYLQLRNIRVVATGAAHDTLQCLREGFRPCVVLTDPRAPGMEAWPLVDYLRTDSVLASVPMILTSSDAMQVRCAHWRGVRECVRKPVSPVAFLDAIERQCQRRYVGLPPAASI